jgi:hypothetical protein
MGAGATLTRGGGASVADALTRAALTRVGPSQPAATLRRAGEHDTVRRHVIVSARIGQHVAPRERIPDLRVICSPCTARRPLPEAVFGPSPLPPERAWRPGVLGARRVQGARGVAWATADLA